MPKAAIDLMLQVIEEYRGDPVPMCADCEELCTSDDLDEMVDVPCLNCALGNFCLDHDLDWLIEMIEDEDDDFDFDFDEEE